VTPGIVEVLAWVSVAGLVLMAVACFYSLARSFVREVILGLPCDCRFRRRGAA
jgi:hypothetical protein